MSKRKSEEGSIQLPIGQVPRATDDNVYDRTAMLFNALDDKDNSDEAVLACVSTLIERDSTLLSKQNGMGQLPIYVAIESGRLPVVKYLLGKMGIKEKTFNLLCDKAIELQNINILEAIKAKNTDLFNENIANYLIEAAENTEINLLESLAYPPSVFEYLYKQLKTLKEGDTRFVRKTLASCLYRAVCSDNLSVTKFLLTEGAELSVKVFYGDVNSLTMAIERACNYHPDHPDWRIVHEFFISRPNSFGDNELRSIVKRIELKHVGAKELLQEIAQVPAKHDRLITLANHNYRYVLPKTRDYIRSLKEKQWVDCVTTTEEILAAAADGESLGTLRPGMSR